VLRGDELGPLHGVPFTVKDTFDTFGIRTTRGSRLFAGYVPERDATVVSRAKAAGAEIAEEPADQAYGDRRYTARDPEGQHWFFATHVRDVAPAEWGAEVAS